MCLFRAPKPTSMPVPPAISPRIEKNTNLPTKKEVVDPNTTADISYGTGQKKASPAAGKKSGTDALKINLNLGEDIDTSTGGANV
tara:strand:+ start:117 stop:371 length:255 start_codon:yes stop_codon:yes gene_type:complete